ncbi:AAA family ATPase [Terrimicrobium sacchariphilum]|nr:AAA family ATPase [Terrimicrobium sacchariphilum]
MESFLREFQAEAGRALIDRERELELALCCFVSGGNLLIEDTPGVGKTTLVKVMARLLGLDFKRVQFTNDLLPADILGSQVFDASRQSFSFHRGPIFAQLVLGDELNRASPRTQSAVLQAMDEHEVTIEGQTYELPEPFFFVGTQNPHEQIGTALLPESQVDRFLMRIALGTPERSTQRKLLERHRKMAGGATFDFHSLRVLVTPEQLAGWQRSAAAVHVSEAVSEYILDLFDGAHGRGWVLSPRASLGLQRAGQARAFLNGREYVLPDDIQEVFLPVTTHRLAQFSRVPGDPREAASMARTLLEQTRSR